MSIESAAHTAHDAFVQLSEARTVGDQACAFVALANAMSDLATWVPGFNHETGRIEVPEDPGV